MYKKVDTKLDFVAREKEILKFWESNDIFEKSKEKSKGKEPFTFYDGPPTANGMPHIGHMLTRAIKDIIPRYKSMKGYDVLRKAGWDTHGLPVELEVEKEIGISGKKEIEDYGIDKFVEKCKHSVWRYEQEWKENSKRIGFWVDMESPYITYENDYIESVWWALKTMWEKDLIYKGHKVLPYCPSCGTALSSHEVAQGYKEIKEDSIYVQFKVKQSSNEENKNKYLLAWTTTPWTLPSNVAVVMHPNEDYVEVEKDNNIYILAKALAEKVVPEGKILKTAKGSEFEYLEYEPLFNFHPIEGKTHFVTLDTYVSLSDGTGIVHTAPAFGEDDNRVAKKYGLPLIQLVNERGQFLDSVANWAGIFVKEADPSIIEFLKAQNNIYKVQNIEHSYPHCWRCDSPLLYYARTAWFIEMTKLRANLTANNNKVNWLPENVKQGRFGNFLENVIDWGLSRERYWGTPLPIWECACGEKKIVGSVAELTELSGKKLADLHKPYIDEIKIPCEKCNAQMTRVPEVIDCWFDSGAMPFAQFHYPFENKELFEKYFPANFISEAIDQTRGWFYTLMAISTAIFDTNPYENVIVLGHVLDSKGKKMSKSKGNAIDPREMLEKVGADAIRWYFYYNSNPWVSSRFGEAEVSEAKGKFMGTLWNTYAFYVLYANIDEFNPLNYKLEHDKLPAMDKWILSKLASTIKNVDKNLEALNITEAAKNLENLVDNLSNWYVRRCRERFWASGMKQDKINAYMTLYTVLTEITKLSAPFTPFIAENMYQNLVCGIDKNAPISIHLTEFPKAMESHINEELEKNMESVYTIVTLGRAARNTANIKTRQPISKIMVKLGINSNASGKLGEEYKEIIKGELNVKEIEEVEDLSNYTSYKFKPLLPILGQKYGKILPKIREFLNNPPTDFLKQIDSGNKFMIDRNEVELTRETIIIEADKTEGFSSESLGEVTVVLETTLTNELIEEGLVRELVSKIQTMRKDEGFEVTDKIHLFYGATEELLEVIEKNIEEIKKETLAVSAAEGTDENHWEWNINGHDVILAVKKA
ncbi:MAG: isoleucine--tRNA ligase [Defluviitaleaceae bacterium]|nr:isoleucine--tRNA ligase [Defluviitaleaceae bacterium]